MGLPEHDRCVSLSCSFVAKASSETSVLSQRYLAAFTSPTAARIRALPAAGQMGLGHVRGQTHQTANFIFPASTLRARQCRFIVGSTWMLETAESGDFEERC